MTARVYVGPGGPVEEWAALTIHADYPDDVESIRTINGHGVVDVTRGGMIAAVVTSPNGRVRAGTIVVLVPLSYNYAGTMMGESGTDRWIEPGNGLVSVSPEHDGHAVVEVRLRKVDSVALAETEAAP